MSRSLRPDSPVYRARRLATVSRALGALDLVDRGAYCQTWLWELGAAICDDVLRETGETIRFAELFEQLADAWQNRLPAEASLTKEATR